MFGKRQGMGMNCRKGISMQSGFGSNGQGQGRGHGLGRGRGRGMGQGNGMMTQLLSTPEQEIDVLVRTASCLKQDLDQVTGRIEALRQRVEAPKAQ